MGERFGVVPQRPMGRTKVVLYRRFEGRKISRAEKKT
jgi:hypothetical protein